MAAYDLEPRNREWAADADRRRTADGSERRGQRETHESGLRVEAHRNFAYVLGKNSSSTASPMPFQRWLAQPNRGRAMLGKTSVGQPILRST